MLTTGRPLARRTALGVVGVPERDESTGDGTYAPHGPQVCASCGDRLFKTARADHAPFRGTGAGLHPSTIAP